MLVDRFGNPLGNIEPHAVSSHIEAKPLSTDARQTVDEDRFVVRTTGSIISITDDNSWTLATLDDTNIAGQSSSVLLNQLANNHPDIGRAIWEMHNNCVTEWTWTARIREGKEDKEDPAGTQVLNEAADYLETVIGEPIEIKLGQLVDSAFLKDHFFTETIFDRDLFLDIKVIDPFTARWQQRDNDGRGQRWQIGQQQGGVFTPLESEFIRFTPLIPQVEKPYGRSVLGSSIYPMVFLLGLIKSAKKVIDTQAWPNRKATISRAELHNSGMKPEAIEILVAKLEKEVSEDMKNSGKGSQFVWDDAVKVEMIGGMNRVNLDAVEMMEKILERWIIRALKQYPILFAIDSGNSLSTNAEQQSEQFATAIDSLLRKLEALFRYHGNHILRHRFGGSYQGQAVFEMKRNNTIVRKFRTEAFKIQNESFIALHAAGAITTQELRTLSIRDDSLNNLSKIISEPLPTELVQLEQQRMQRLQAPEESNESEPEPESEPEESNEE